MIKAALQGTKGRIISIIILVFLCGLSSFRLFKNYQGQVLDKINAHNIYTSQDHDKDTVLLVKSIQKTNIEVNGERFYLVEHTDGYVYVAANPSDPIINQTLEETSKNRFLLVSGISSTQRVGSKGHKYDYYNITKSLQSDMQAELQRLYPQAVVSQLALDHYMSRTKYVSSSQSLSVIFVIMLMIIVVLLRSLYKRIRSNQKAYNDIQTAFPEIKALGDIKTNARLQNRQMKLYLYKNALISFNAGIKVFFVENIINMYRTQHTARTRRSSTTYYVLSIFQKGNQYDEIYFNYRIRNVTPEVINVFLRLLLEEEPRLKGVISLPKKNKK